MKKTITFQFLLLTLQSKTALPLNESLLLKVKIICSVREQSYEDIPGETKNHENRIAGYFDTVHLVRYSI
jgi:hypothetical protein